MAPVINNTFSFIKQFQENLFTVKLKLQNASTGYNVKNIEKKRIKGEWGIVQMLQKKPNQSKQQLLFR